MGKTAFVRLAVLLLLAASALAFDSYVSRLPNGNAVVYNGVTVAALGHASTSGGGARNAFGTAFAAAGYRWSQALCTADTDGDGITNGEELGDPTCVWTPGATPARTTDLSHPSQADSIPTQTFAPQGTLAPTPAPTPAPANAGLNAAAIAGYAASNGNAFYEAVKGKVWITWAMDTTTTPADPQLLMTMRVKGAGLHGAIGWCKERMTGPMVSCWVSDDATEGGVYDFDGKDYEIIGAPSTARAVGLGYSRTGDDAFCSFRISANAVGIDSSGNNRVIFSVSDFKRRRPEAHAGSHDGVIGRASADWYNLRIRNTFYAMYSNLALAYLITILILIVSLVIGFICKHQGIVLSPGATKVVMIVHVLLWLGCFALVIGTSHADLERDKPSEARVFRAFGHGCVYMFGFILFPITKHTSPLRLFGMSYERQIPFHIIAGLLIFIFSTIHFIGMAVEYDRDPISRKFIIRWGGQRQINIAGLIAWICITIMVIISVFLRRKFFNLFRFTHFLFIVAIIFVIIHWNGAGLIMAPGLFLWVLDFIMRLYTNGRAKASVSSAKYVEAARATKIEVKIDGELPAEGGQYMFLGFKGLGALAHPFSIANYNAESKTATFFTRNMGPGKFTDKIAQNADSLAMDMVMGPYGSLQVPLNKINTAILVSGGIGITPMMSILQEIGDGKNGANGVNHVVFVWSFREEALAEMIAPYLLESAAKIESRGGKVIWEICSSKASTDNIAGLPINKCRPNIGDTVNAAMGSFDESGAKDGKGIAVYACGPPELMASAGDAASSNGTWFHSETFEF